MTQPLARAQAITHEPDLVLLDEPTSALDPVGRREVRDLIRSLQARGPTVFLNSHLLSEVEMVCDRVAVVDHGRVIALGTIHDLLRGADIVRIRMTGLNGRLGPIQGFASPSEDGDWLTFRGVKEERVPELVAEIVRLGGSVYAVEPQQQSLEDRFLQLLEDEEAECRAPSGRLRGCGWSRP